MPPQFQSVTFAHLHARVIETRRHVESLGINWGSRFGAYQAEIAAKVSAPRQPPNPVYREALNQLQQIVMSQPLWRDLAPGPLKGTLRRVVGGDVLPVTDDDPHRNALVELTTATMMANAGFCVDLTNDEDLTAEAPPSEPPLAPLAVECKRPLSTKSLLTNIKKIRKQLRVRFTNGSYEHGIGVVAIDRMVTLPASFPNDAAAAHHVKRVMTTTGYTVARHCVKLGLQPAKVPSIGLLLVGTADDLTEGSIYTIVVMEYAFYSRGAEHLLHHPLIEGIRRPLTKGLL